MKSELEYGPELDPGSLHWEMVNLQESVHCPKRSMLALHRVNNWDAVWVELEHLRHQRDNWQAEAIMLAGKCRQLAINLADERVCHDGEL